MLPSVPLLEQEVELLSVGSSEDGVKLLSIVSEGTAGKTVNEENQSCMKVFNASETQGNNKK
jgi:hypothetical protein